MLAAVSYDPIVHISLGPLNISPHGVGIAVGFLCGAMLMLPAARQRGIDDETVFSLLTRAAIGSIIGARVAYVINHFGDYESPLEILQIWKGGISLLGGFTGAIVAALPEMRKRGISFWKAMDAAAPGMALGVVVGRVGDLIVADHLGKPTTFFLGYLCPPVDVDTASPCPAGVVVHHTALYDMVLTMFLLGLLLWLRRRPRFDGFLILTFFAVYGMQRVVEDFLREDVRRFGLTGSQWTALTALTLSLYVLFVRKRTPWWGQWDATPVSAGEVAPRDVDLPPPDVPPTDPSPSEALAAGEVAVTPETPDPLAPVEEPAVEEPSVDTPRMTTPEPEQPPAPREEP